MDPVKLAKLQAQAAKNRIGGKGTPRRKVVKKVANPQDDKKLQAALKKLNVQAIAGIEEVNMFQEDGNVLHFSNPRVHGAASSNTFAVYGSGSVKDLTELVPGILSQLGPDSLASLRKLAETYQANQAAVEGANKAAGAAADDDDDDVPDLVESFDAPAEDKAAETKDAEPKEEAKEEAKVETKEEDKDAEAKLEEQD